MEREELFSVFISNLSGRISRIELWELFSYYGRVKDVFVRFRRSKPHTFAFVRYQYEWECDRAIVWANDRSLDGRRINMKRAAARRMEGKEGAISID